MVLVKDNEDFPRSDGSANVARRSERNVVKRQNDQLFKSKS